MSSETPPHSSSSPMCKGCKKFYSTPEKHCLCSYCHRTLYGGEELFTTQEQRCDAADHVCQMAVKNIPEHFLSHQQLLERIKRILTPSRPLEISTIKFVLQTNTTVPKEALILAESARHLKRVLETKLGPLHFLYIHLLYGRVIDNWNINTDEDTSLAKCYYASNPRPAPTFYQIIKKARERKAMSNSFICKDSAEEEIKFAKFRKAVKEGHRVGGGGGGDGDDEDPPTEASTTVDIVSGGSGGSGVSSSSSS